MQPRRTGRKTLHILVPTVEIVQLHGLIVVHWVASVQKIDGIIDARYHWRGRRWASWTLVLGILSNLVDGSRAGGQAHGHVCMVRVLGNVKEVILQYLELVLRVRLSKGVNEASYKRPRHPGNWGTPEKYHIWVAIRRCRCLKTYHSLEDLHWIDSWYILTPSMRESYLVTIVPSPSEGTERPTTTTKARHDESFRTA